jgi:hypothetical protein
MLDETRNSTISALSTHGGAAAHRVMQVVKIAVLLVSVAAAVPTAQNLYYSWKTGVPFNQVQHRLTQAALWEKNFDCKIDYRTLVTADKSKVEVGSCAKTRDISIRVSSGKQTNYEWIAFEQLPKPATETAGFLDLFIAKAYAEEPVSQTSDARIVVAQSTMQVMCESRTKDSIIRIVKDSGKCFKETVSLFKGTVEKREEVACNSQCN